MRRQKGVVGLVVLGVVVALILFVGVSLMGSYNGFVSSRNEVQTSWSAVEAQYERRFDLIPNLQESVKGIFAQEQSVFKAIADARTKYAGTQPNTPERVEATNGLEGAIGRLLVIIENYPELKSNAQVTQLMEELAGTENRIAVARVRYNETAKGYNTSVEQFPGNVIAGVFGFKKFEYYTAVEEAQKAPAVNLQLNK